MKNRYFRYSGVLCALGCSLALGADLGSTASPEGGESVGASEAAAASSSAVSRGVGLRATLLAAVQADASRDYAIARGGGALAANNAAQGFVSSFTREGVTLRSPKRAWELKLSADALGCAGEEAGALATAPPQADGNRVEYRRATPDGVEVTEWYVNGPLGVEQGFELERAPSCRGAGGGAPVIELTTAGGLTPEASAAGAVLRDEDGRVSLRYSELYVSDADGLQVPARIEVEGSRIRIRVEDEGARYPLTVDPLIAVESAKLVASDGAFGDNFGRSVDVDGDTVIVGSIYDDPPTDAGSAYVFVYENDMWVEQAKLQAADIAADDQFGVAVAISGDTAIVGALFDDDNGSASGSAYVFVRDGNNMWTEQAKLTASDAAAQVEFGRSVAVDADTAIVGAAEEDTGGTNSGAVYVYVRDNMNNWTEEAKLKASDAAFSDEFGWAVAVQGDQAIVGARLNDDNGGNSGSAYVFVRNGNTWMEQAKLLPSDGEANDEFGRSVAIDTDTSIVGAPFEDDGGSNSGAAYVFLRDNNDAWMEQAKLVAADAAADDRLGFYVDIVGDRALATAARDDDPDAGVNAGSAYLFERDADVWTEYQNFIGSDPGANDQFGFSAAMSDTWIAIGVLGDDELAANAGAAYVYGFLLGQGDACDDDNACVGGMCVDGVCCDSECGLGDPNDCQACSIAEGASQDGTCEPVAADTECRAAAGVCDVAEVCDGVEVTCPEDVVVPADDALECRAAAGDCDVAELCDGVLADCPEDMFVPADDMQECRASADMCDAAELCDGQGAECPADAPADDGTECDDGVCMDGVCEPVEATTGGMTTGGDTTGDPSAGTDDPSAGTDDPSAGTDDSGSTGDSGTGGSTDGTSAGSDDDDDDDDDDTETDTDSPATGGAEDGGCSCSADGDDPRGAGALGIALLVLVAGRRRRR